MPEIKLEKVVKQWGNFCAVDNLNLTIQDNAFITLLGPSGCGKTTTLRMIAGLDTPTSGKITIGNEVVYDSEQGINVPANKRKVGFLFQNYALWPNMTVYENISFGLTNIKEEMPLFDEEAKVLTDKIRILKDPEKLYQILMGQSKEESIRRLIESYNVTKYTAEDIYKGCKSSNDTEFSKYRNTLLDVFKNRLANIMEAHVVKGEVLNDSFQITVGGKVLTGVRKLTDEEIDMAVQSSASIVKIGMFMDRYPAELSGGQQQRVAIARTLAPKPKVLFMDEPLSNLDAKLRLGMRYELQRLHVTTGATFVYVTHDQMEAMTLATKICLMNNGVLQQYDAPLDVYLHPNNTFTADFVGNPSINFIHAKGVQSESGSFELTILDNLRIDFKPEKPIDYSNWLNQLDENKNLQKESINKVNKDELFQPNIEYINDKISDEENSVVNGNLLLAVRPEYIEICDNGKFEAEVYGAMPTGMESTVKLRINNFLLTGVVFGSITFKIGQKVKFNIAGDGVLLFDQKSGLLITNGSIKRD